MNLLRTARRFWRVASVVRRSFAPLILVALVFATPKLAFAGDSLAIGPGAIVALVRDENGHPVAGALVIAEGPAARDATTTVGGVVTLLDLPLGSYDVRISRDGYEPADARVRVEAGRSLEVTRVRLTLTSFASLGARAGTTTLRASPHAAGDPAIAHTLAAASSIVLLPVGRTRGAAAATLLGTNANETRYELDGIPLAGGPLGAGTLAARSGLGIDAIELARGPLDSSATPRGAIGGIVNYRTIALARDDGASIGAGYSSYFGYFQQYRLARRHDRLSVAFDLSSGDALSHAQTIKAQYALSNATSIGVASYGLQSGGFASSAGYAFAAPIVAADLRTTIGHTSLRVRAYSSSIASSSLTASSLANAIASTVANPLIANERLEGTQADLALPFGENVAAATFDRRNERTTYPGGITVRRSFTTQTLRADLALTKASRLSLADALSSGSQLSTRNDPQVSLSLRAGDSTTVRFSAGSSYAVAPAQTLAAQALEAETLAALVRPFERYPQSPLDAQPETAFGYRVDVEQQLTSQTRVYADAYEIRARDRFAALSDARTSGVEVGEQTEPSGGRVTFDGYLDLARSLAFGTAQSVARYAASAATNAPLLVNAQSFGDPYSKARIEATYRSLGGAEMRVGNTFYGANNAFAANAVSLADASLYVPLDPFDVRFGVSNAFGAAVAPQGLAPYFAPHQITFSLQRAFGAAP